MMNVLDLRKEKYEVDKVDKLVTITVGCNLIILDSKALHELYTHTFISQEENNECQ